jgi:DNA-binding XRE family transcriptional regulator
MKVTKPHGRVAFLTLVPKTLKGLRPLPYNPNPTTLGEHMLKRRIELGLFQKDIAERLGINLFTVLNWEHDRATPPIRF